MLKDLVYRENEVQSKDGRFFTVRIAPYRTLENIIDGVVITFVDITLIKNLKAEHRLAAVVKDSNDAITVQDFLGNITAWNKGAEAMYGYSEAEALKMNIKELIPLGESEAELKFVQQIKTGLDVKPFKAKRKTKDGRILEVWLTVTRLDDDAGNPIEIATTERGLVWLAKM